LPKWYIVNGGFRNRILKWGWGVGKVFQKAFSVEGTSIMENNFSEKRG